MRDKRCEMPPATRSRWLLRVSLRGLLRTATSDKIQMIIRLGRSAREKRARRAFTTEAPLHQGCSAKLRRPTHTVGRFIGEGGHNVRGGDRGHGKTARRGGHPPGDRDSRRRCLKPCGRDELQTWRLRNSQNALQEQCTSKSYPRPAPT